MNKQLLKLKNAYINMPLQSKAAVWYAICSFVQKGIIFLTTPIFSRLLTTEEYGVFSVYTTWQNIIIIVATLNLASGVFLRGLIKYEGDESEFSTSIYSLFGLIYAVVFVIYLAFSGFWNDLFSLRTEYMLCMFADMLVSTAFHFWSAFQRVHYAYRKLILVTVANAVLRPVLGVIAIYLMDNNVLARILSMTIADALCFGVFLVSMFTSGITRTNFSYWSYALRYNIPLVPHYLSQIVLNQSDRIMIEHLCGSAKAGIYSLAYTCAMIMHVISQAILNSYNPWMYRNIRDEKYEDINKVSLQLLLLIAGANILLILAAPEIIRIMAPPDYYEAVWIIPPVAMGMFFMFMYNLFSNFEFYYERTRFMMIASLTGAVLNVILNYCFIPVYGYIAAGYTTLFCYIFYCVAHYVMMVIILKHEKYEKPVYDLKSILLITAAFVAAGFILTLTYTNIFIRYALIALILILALRNRKRILAIVKYRSKD